MLLIISFFAVQLKIPLLFFLLIAGLAVIFGSLAVLVAVFSKSERDTILTSTLVVTPMTFLCGTFFPLERLPLLLQQLAWLSPVTPGVYSLRALALGQSLDFSVLGLVVMWTAVSFFLAGYFLEQEEF